MNGRRFILDTNAFISLLKGNSAVLKFLEHADWIGISIISRIEFLSFRGLSDAIIISTAISNHSTLITADKQLNLVKELDIFSYEL
jgi:predicted nucleic acid-binding protein